MKPHCVGLMIVMSLGWGSSGALTTIYDSGNTVDINNYLRILKERTLGAPAPLPDSAVTRLPTFFPLKTVGLSPGEVNSHDAYYPGLPNPLCVVGADQYSRAWLAANRQALTKAHAFCWIVQANSMSEVQALRAIGRGVQMLPSSGNDLITYYGIDHYPVLITQRAVLQ